MLGYKDLIGVSNSVGTYICDLVVSGDIVMGIRYVTNTGFKRQAEAGDDVCIQLLNGSTYTGVISVVTSTDLMFTDGLFTPFCNIAMFIQ